MISGIVANENTEHYDFTSPFSALTPLEPKTMLLVATLEASHAIYFDISIIS